VFGIVRGSGYCCRFVVWPVAGQHGHDLFLLWPWYVAPLRPLSNSSACSLLRTDIGDHVQFAGDETIFVVEEINVFATRLRSEIGHKVLSISNQNLDRQGPIVIEQSCATVRLKFAVGLSQEERHSLQEIVVSYVSDHPDVYATQDVTVQAKAVNIDGSVIYEVGAKLWQGEPRQQRSAELLRFCTTNAMFHNYIIAGTASQRDDQKGLHRCTIE
jgi:hypothetical protein